MKLLITLILNIIFIQPMIIDKKHLGCVDDIVENALEDQIFPGAGLLVGQSDRIVWRKGYGFYTYDDNSIPVSVEGTMFDLASLSKVVGTTMATMLLLQKRKLALDDSVSQYIELFAGERKKTVTIKDLLVHTSGLKPDEDPNVIEVGPQENNSEAIIRHIAQLPLLYQPRTKVVYSCLNFYLLAHINELISQERQENFIRRTVFEPLGMHSAYRLTDEQKKLCAPTARDLQGIVHDPLARFYGLEYATPGNAGIFATGPDLVPFCEMILNDGMYRGKQILQPETVALMTRCYTEKLNKRRGLGFNILDEYPYTSLHMKDDNPKSYIVGHTGYTGTMIGMDLLSKSYMIFLTNRVYSDEKRSVISVRKKIIKTVLESIDGYN